MEQALVERAGLKFESISAVGLRGKNPAAALGSLWYLSQGYRQSRQILRRFQPDLLFITGGYVGVPVTLAAWQARVPVVIYLPDIKPGLAIKFLARFARQVAVTAPEAEQYFRPGLAVVTGYPVRPELFDPPFAGEDQAQATARRLLNLEEDLPVLIVFGGSRGARSINRAVTANLEAYLEVCQIVHISGTLDEAWVQARRASLPPELQARYHVSAYLHEQMITALIAADLAISRAGASVLGEFPAVGLPAILVPYPYAGAHQACNANYLTRHNAAVTIKDDVDLDQMLKQTAANLIINPEKLQAMRKACEKLARPDAASRLAQVILEVGSHGA
jgi:UDP-N-acetylglucosamine--N-acetylmuramyl-(pentapeptide) pyrophosphoryl-undecaprenol N-acetylglucosamine transferase